MRTILPRVKQEWCDQILVVDGGSTDATVEYAREQGYELVLQKRPGMMNACREAFPHIRNDVFIVFSPDGNSLPEAIPALIAKMESGYDLVIASRYMEG